MKNILIFGAGRSATILIRYLLQEAAKNDWSVTIADASAATAYQKTAGHPNGKGVGIDAGNPEARLAIIRLHDLVISLLPPFMHLDVAKDCLKAGVHILTASYITPEMKALDQEFKSKGLLFMGEMGLDPGIDHLSAMQLIDHIKGMGGKITAFRSYCGGLIAPESDTNPWHYKFTWNPRNVILAGQGTAQYLENGIMKYLPYHRLFREYRTIEVPGMGEWEVYANRDSLGYQEVYGLAGIRSLLRGTIRHKGFCDAWNTLVQLGLTDNSYHMHGSKKMTTKKWIESMLPVQTKGSIRNRVAKLAGYKSGSETLDKVTWLGLFDNISIDTLQKTPAQVLEALLLEKWKLEQEDNDMIIMHHEFEMLLDNQKKSLTSSMVIKGDDALHTAMAKTVGLPVGILASLLMKGKIRLTGVHIPVMKEVYDPVLKELAENQIVFKEEKNF